MIILDKQHALELKGHLDKVGIMAMIVEQKKRGKLSYVVQLGTFTNLADAKKLVEVNLTKRQYKAMVKSINKSIQEEGI